MVLEEPAEEFLHERAVRHWEGFPGAAPSLLMFRRCVDMEMRDVVWWWDAVGQLGGWTR